MSNALQSAHHLKVRMGDCEFEATGDMEVVNTQYAQYLEAIRNFGGRNPSPVRPGKHDGLHAREPAFEGVWARFYSPEPENNVSLKVLPSTDQVNADALVLLLYGYEHLCQRDTVGSAEFLAMAKKSGLRIDRIDRNIPAAYNRYINRGGSRRGCRYSLNNQGKAYAQQLLDDEAEK